MTELLLLLLAALVGSELITGWGAEMTRHGSAVSATL